jgi:pimeloyl-ACP methyl ester carboxylesterase
MTKELDRKENKLNADGVSIGYFEVGNGAPVMVFPAIGSELSSQLLNQLAESYRVICFDLTGRDLPAVDQMVEKLPRALATIGIERYSMIGVAAGARPALALAIAAPERADRLILLSPLIWFKNGESVDLAGVAAATLVLVGTRDAPDAIAAGRLCREKIRSCHLSFVYGAGQLLVSDRVEACLNPIVQFLEEGEQFIISRESQAVRP